MEKTSELQKWKDRIQILRDLDMKVFVSWPRWRGKEMEGTDRQERRENASQAPNASWDSSVVWVEKETWREGGRKGAILMLIQNRSCFSFVRAVPHSPFTLHLLFCLRAIMMVMWGGRGRAIHLSADVRGKNCVILRPRGLCCVCVSMRERVR